MRKETTAALALLLALLASSIVVVVGSWIGSRSVAQAALILDAALFFGGGWWGARRHFGVQVRAILIFSVGVVGAGVVTLVRHSADLAAPYRVASVAVIACAVPLVLWSARSLVRSRRQRYRHLR